MAEPDNPTSEPRPSGEPRTTSEERPLWSLNRDEQRLLAITFVGGLASLVIGAGLIGAAIWLGRWALAHPSFLSLPDWLTKYELPIGLFLTLVGGAIGRSKHANVYIRIGAWIASAIGLLLVLTIIGIGAGIH